MWRGWPALALWLAVPACGDITELIDADDATTAEVIRIHRSGSGPMPADSTSRESIRAVLPPGADVRDVVFKTTAGRFLVSGTGDRTVRADPDAARMDSLVARVTLVAPAVPGTGVVSAAIADFTDWLEIEFVASD